MKMRVVMGTVAVMKRQAVMYWTDLGEVYSL